MYKQVLDPVNHSLGETSLFAVLPLLVLFLLLLGVFNVRAHWAALAGPGDLDHRRRRGVLDAVWTDCGFGIRGAVFGLFPIMSIIVNAIWPRDLHAQLAPCRRLGGESPLRAGLHRAHLQPWIR
jgi:lactate permease